MVYLFNGNEELTLGKNASIPLMHHDPKELGLHCNLFSREIQNKEIQNPFFGFKNPILDFP